RQARDDRGAAAPADLHGRPRRGAPSSRAARLLRRLEPRAARRQVREAGEHDQDLAAARVGRDPGVPGLMTDDTDTSATPDLLAAEYVLGTLASNEREEAEALIASDPSFERLVRYWEHRLGQLHALVPPVEPPPETWEHVQARVEGAEPSAVMHLPDPGPAARARAPGNVVDLTRRLGRWRQVSAGLGAIAAALVAFIVTSAIKPDLLPEPLRPKPIEIIKTVEVPSPTGR